MPTEKLQSGESSQSDLQDYEQPSDDAPQTDDEQPAEEVVEKLDVEVTVDSPSTCERHITVTISREDIDRYYEKAFSEMMPTATVPGFRPGRAPRKLVEHRFRKDVTDQIKGSLLMDSMSQISEEQNLTAISEPEFDVDAIEVPDDGPMTYEFDLEVRPEFDLPEWQGLSIERPAKEFTDKEVEDRLEQILMSRGQLVPHDGKAAVGDYLSVNVTTKHGDEELASERETQIRLRPTLSFRDGKLEKFDKLMKDVKAGETRKGEVELTQDAANESLRGKKVDATFEILEIKRVELPELTSELLAQIDAGQNEEELRGAIKEDLDRQLQYHQQQLARRQITAKLTQAADWELPPGLLRRQSQRELERAVLELRRSGFGEEAIRARENELRQNSGAATARAMKEHFILEKIAEQQEIDAAPEDFDVEIALIAAQSDQSVRRVRAQLDKRGLMDSVRNQIIERKVIELVLSQAEFNDVPYQPGRDVDISAIDLAAGGDPHDAGIPEAT